MEQISLILELPGTTCMSINMHNSGLFAILFTLINRCVTFLPKKSRAEV